MVAYLPHTPPITEEGEGQEQKEDIMLGDFLAIGFLIIIALIGIGTHRMCDKIEKKKMEPFQKPLICVCEVNRRIGVVLKKDFDKASKNHWGPYYSGEKHYDAAHINAPWGHRITIDPVFVFDSHSKEYYTLAFGCYAEQAIFHVPPVARDEVNPIKGAFQYIHGKPFNGHIFGIGEFIHPPRK